MCSEGETLAGDTDLGAIRVYKWPSSEKLDPDGVWSLHPNLQAVLLLTAALGLVAGR